MPYPNEHAARIKDPNDFKTDSFRRKTIEKGIAIIVGKVKDDGDSMITQAYRFDKTVFTVAKAKKWLKDNDIEYISFEAASEAKSEYPDANLESRSESLIECRFIQNEGCQIRAITSDDGIEQHFVTGIGVVYNVDTELWTGFTERIAPGAFGRSLSKFNVIKSFVNHNPQNILSTTRSNPALELLDGDDGLYFTSPIPPTSYGNDLIVNLKRENIRGASFSFTINPGGEEYEIDKEGNMYRTITDAEIYEIGPVTNPAYEQTEVSLRSKDYFSQKLKWLTDKKRSEEKCSDNELDIINAFLLKRKGV